MNARLAEVLSGIWKDVLEADLARLWKSMPNRVAAVIDAKEWNTRY